MGIGWVGYPNNNNSIAFSQPFTKNQLVGLCKDAGSVLYLDARFATGTGKPTNSPLTNPWVDLSGIQNTYALANSIGENGNFGTDTNSDGLGDGWANIASSTSISMTGNVQTFTPVSTNGGIGHDFTAALGRIYYACAYVKTSAPSVVLAISDTPSAVTKAHTGGGAWEFLSCLLTKVVNDASATVAIASIHASSFGEVQAKQVIVFDLTAIFGAGKEPTQTYMDRLVQNQNSYINSLSITQGNDAVAVNFAGTTASGVDGTDSSRPFWVFDGTDDRGDLINTASLNITAAPLAIFATVKMPDALQTGYIVAKNKTGSGDIQYGFQLTSDGNFLINMEGSSRHNPTAGLQTSTWYNVGFFWDGAVIRSYKNFVEFGTPSNYAATLTEREYLRIGCRADSTLGHSVFFKGSISSITVYTGNDVSKILKAEKAISKAYIT